MYPEPPFSADTVATFTKTYIYIALFSQFCARLDCVMFCRNMELANWSISPISVSVISLVLGQSVPMEHPMENMAKWVRRSPTGFWCYYIIKSFKKIVSILGGACCTKQILVIFVIMQNIYPQLCNTVIYIEISSTTFEFYACSKTICDFVATELLLSSHIFERPS